MQKRIVAIASGGGHWVQLRRLAAAFEGHRVVWVSVDRALAGEVEPAPFYAVRDATRWNKLGLVLLFFQVARILLRERPDVVVSTGAAPGYLALRLAKLLGARTLWLDSVANAERLSLSGERVGRYADLWLTQWPHLVREGGPLFRGAVL